MKRTFLVSLVGITLVAAACMPGHAEEASTLVSIGADYWMPGVDAEVQSSDLGVIGSQVDIIDDLGQDDSQSVPAFHGSLDLPLLPELLISYFTVDDSASKVITKQIVYKGTTYNVSDTVSSSYDITHYEALLGLSLINNDTAKLGLLIGSKYFEVETSITSAGLTQSDSVDGPVPVVGVMGALALPGKFKIEGMARGLALEIDDVDAKLFDIEAALHYDFNRFLRASAGYRYFLIDAEDTKNNDKVDITFAGPYIGVTASF